MLLLAACQCFSSAEPVERLLTGAQLLLYSWWRTAGFLQILRSSFTIFVCTFNTSTSFKCQQAILNYCQQTGENGVLCNQMPVRNVLFLFVCCTNLHVVNWNELQDKNGIWDTLLTFVCSWELDSMILLGPFQLGIFCDLLNKSLFIFFSGLSPYLYGMHVTLKT